MKIVATNRRAKFDYDISEKLLVGIVLTGAEVKSIKQGHVSLKGSYATIARDELYLLNTHVSPYKYAGPSAFEETRSRKLLAHKNQVEHLAGLKQSGMALFPLAIGIERGLVKIEIGVGRGRKQADKRQVIRKRQADRDIARAMRVNNHK